MSEVLLSTRLELTETPQIQAENNVYLPNVTGYELEVRRNKYKIGVCRQTSVSNGVDKFELTVYPLKVDTLGARTAITNEKFVLVFSGLQEELIPEKVKASIEEYLDQRQ